MILTEFDYIFKTILQKSRVQELKESTSDIHLLIITVKTIMGICKKIEEARLSLFHTNREYVTQELHTKVDVIDVSLG